jgi:hypothetical protein
MMCSALDCCFENDNTGFYGFGGRADQPRVMPVV